MTFKYRKSRSGAATIIDVAELAGVSIKTVSRVINNQRYVSKATAERVQKAAETLNFQPNQFARNLASKQSFQVALWHGLVKTGISGYYTKVQNHFVSACWDMGYGAELDPFDPDYPRLLADAFAVLAARRPCGVVLIPPVSDDEEFIARLEQEQIAFVRMSPSVEDDGRSFVATNDAAAAQSMTEHLLDIGHRRIGFITGHPAHGAAARRTTGFQAAHRQRDIPLDDGLIVSGRFSFDSGVHAAQELLSLPDRPTAIFAANDDMAAGVIHFAHEKKLSLPEDLSVAGFDDSALAEYIYPSITTVRQPIPEMVRAAVRYLIERSQSKSTTPESMRRTFDCELVVRESVGPPRAPYSGVNGGM